jgi:drug/metabolite transporter (DMT)-like permease
MNRSFIGSLFVLLSATGYAFLPIFARLAYRTDITPFELLTWRFVIAAGAIWALWPLWGKRANLGALTRRDVLILAGLGGLFALVAYIAFLGLSRLPAPLFSMLFYTYPAITALLSLILGERLPVPAWLAVGLAVAGSALTGLSAEPSGAAYNPLDLGIPLLTALIYAIYLVLVQRYTRHTSGLASAVVSITGSLILLIAASPIIGLRVPSSGGAWLPIAGIAVFSTVFTILLMFEGIARIGASRAAILSTVEPVAVIILALLILNEQAATVQYLGGALILASVILLNLPIGRTPGEAELEQPH